MHGQENEYLPNNKLTTHDLFLSRRQKHYSYHTEGLKITAKQQPELQPFSSMDLISFLRSVGRHVVLLLSLLSLTLD